MTGSVKRKRKLASSRNQSGEEGEGVVRKGGIRGKAARETDSIEFRPAWGSWWVGPWWLGQAKDEELFQLDQTIDREKRI